ncbi:MAG: reverse transcriptase family protein, partial [Sedimenticola sp.]
MREVPNRNVNIEVGNENVIDNGTCANTDEYHTDNIVYRSTAVSYLLGGCDLEQTVNCANKQVNENIHFDNSPNRNNILYFEHVDTVDRGDPFNHLTTPSPPICTPIPSRHLPARITLPTPNPPAPLPPTSPPPVPSSHPTLPSEPNLPPTIPPSPPPTGPPPPPPTFPPVHHLHEVNRKKNKICGLKIGSLNVCGLRHRLLYPDFVEHIKEYDIFTVLETKLDAFDIITLPGYTFLSQHRKQKYLRKSGGIGLFVKDCYTPYLSLIESDSDYTMWVKIHHYMLTVNEDILLGLIYQPPESSRFYNADEAENLEVEITSMCIEYSYVYLLGDINGRVSNLDDYTCVDEFLSDHFEFDADLTEHFNRYTALNSFNMTTKRTSQDTRTNKLGLKLLDTCKLNNLFIINGRCDTDKGVGAFTFRQNSVIDYAISSHKGLEYISKFVITELDALYSDGHACISLTLNFKPTTNNKNTGTQKSQTQQSKPKWKPENKQDFDDNLNIELLNNITYELNQITEDIKMATQEHINTITDKISVMFEKSATKSFKSEHYNTKTDKIWYGHECNNTRTEYLHSKNVFKSNPSETNKQRLKTTSKKYKKTLNKHISKHKQKAQTKIRELHSNKPKEFWKILNNIDKKKTDDKISLDTLYEYFKEMNANDNPPDNEQNFNINISDDDEILNSKISEDEIRKCARNLKNNKSPSLDNVLNEYIKCTLDKLLPIYQSLFNIILDTGILPESWLVGVIKPIYKHKGETSDPGNYRPITLVSCFGKLFTAILNVRLNSFLEHEEILNENQAGFRKNYSTSDHIFVLYALIDILKSRKQKLFCTFIDFSKAFDSVWRVGLWQKLLSNNINGKIFRVI